jgi:hypothetical protein
MGYAVQAADALWDTFVSSRRTRSTAFTLVSVTEATGRPQDFFAGWLEFDVANVEILQRR